MNRILRLATAAVVAVVSLAFAGNALATQQLFVSQTSSSLTFKAQQAQGDQQPAHIAIDVPTGYQIATGQAVGTKIGTTTGDVLARDAGIPFPFTGDVLVADSAHPPAFAALCGPGPYLAIWNLHIVIGGAATADLYFNVKAASGPFAYTLETCLAPSDTPAGSPGRSPGGAQLLDSVLTLNNIFTAVASPVRWTSLWTPYAAGTGVPNPAGTVEARAFVGDGAVTLKAKILNRKKKLVRLSGVVTQGGLGAIRGAIVKITANARRLAVGGSALSGANGSFSISVRNPVKKVTTTFFQATASALPRDVTASGCANPIAPPFPCVSATASGFSVQSAKVKVRV
jgi:hypothetical protein